MANPSYYFTLYKRLQILGHVPAGTNHGAGIGGFDLSDPHAVFGSSDVGPLLAPTNNPADSPLWAVLNSRAMGNDGFTTVDVDGQPWPTMPAGTGTSPPSWAEFQVDAPVPKLVTVLGDWIIAGKIDDVPDQALAQIPSAIKRLDDGVVPFVCNMAGDDGWAPVPSNYWATSLIFLVDPANGNSVSPAHLGAGEEYFLTAIIGNRGEQPGGRYSVPAGPAIESEAHVMVWNVGTSPAVKLPALSNLDTTSTVPRYESYFLRSGSYDLVGFRLPVQTVFDGLVAAVGESDIDLGGASAADWVLNYPAHLCARVRVRRSVDAWPSLSDSPTVERRVAQKNLAPLSVDLTVEDPDPEIEWHNFVVGDALRLWRLHKNWGAVHLNIEATVRPGEMGILLAVPKDTFDRIDAGTLSGFEVHTSEGLNVPFPNCVVLRYCFGANRVPLPRLAEHEFLALSLGIRRQGSRMRPGTTRQVSVVQRTWVPEIDSERDCFRNDWEVTGGFTITVKASVNERQRPARGR